MLALVGKGFATPGEAEDVERFVEQLGAFPAVGDFRMHFRVPAVVDRPEADRIVTDLRSQLETG